jgi:hypothetical protein
MHDYIPLFWRSNYANVQSQDSFLAGIDSFNKFHINLDDSEYRTWLVINQNPNGLRSPCKATFGGAFSQEIDFLSLDLTKIIFGLKENFAGCRLEILLPPEHLREFDPANQLQVLTDLGATVDFVERSNYLPLDDWNYSKLSKGNRKKLRQWIESSGSIEKVDYSHIAEVYEIILLNRLALGVEPSISLEGLQSLFSNFPSEYSLYLGRVNQKNAVAAVVVQNSLYQDYVFFWADTSMFRHLSPVVAMCDFLVKSARDKGMRFLDLGAAQIDGDDIPGLVRFKANLGALPSSKYQLSMIL